jgi:hypothetical protein
MNRNNINDISANRRQKKQTKRTVTIMITMFSVILLVVVVLNIRTIIAPLEGIGGRFSRENHTAGSFPLRLPGSADVINPFGEGEGFMLLSPTYVYTYAPDGGMRFSRRHGYSQPQSAVGGERVLVYDHNGRRFSVFEAGGLVYENLSNDRVIYGALGEDGSAAVVYRGESHVNILSLYGPQGNWRFTKRFSGENVMQVAFSSSGNDIFVTTVGFEAGNMLTTVRRFNTASTDRDGMWQTSLGSRRNAAGGDSDAISASLLPVAVHVRGNSVYVLCDSSLFVLDANSGSIVGSYRFRGALVDYAFCSARGVDTNVALLIGDYTAGNIRLITFDRSARPLYSREVAAGASQIEFTLEAAPALALLESGALTLFDPNTSAQTASFPLNEDFMRFIGFENAILLLGYNSVERLQRTPDAS